VPTYLDDIIAYHRQRAALDSRSLSELHSFAERSDPPRGFANVLANSGRRGESVALIAEIKRRSPSRGPLAVDLEPIALAQAYERGGANCLSVLTDKPHFAGSAEDLQQARAAVALPVLRKDFTVAECDLFDAAAMGADAILLIVAALSKDELRKFIALARELMLDALVEVHDQKELDQALGAGASVIGVNQRDLNTFTVDPKRAVELASSIPESVVRVAESGITSRADVERLCEAGFDAILVGEALVTASDPEERIPELLGLPPRN